MDWGSTSSWAAESRSSGPVTLALLCRFESVGDDDSQAAGDEGASSVARAMAQTRSAAPARRNLSSIIDADSGKMATQGYHYTSMALIPLTPLAFVLSPSSFFSNRRHRPLGHLHICI